MNHSGSGRQMDDLDLMLPPNCPNPYYDTWDRHSSIAFTTAAKGLRNAPGENNCFVNSAVQVFWHLDVFRRSYRRLSGHTCMGNSCIFCALKVIFTQFQFSDQSSLHPDALRKALAETFANQQRFQLGHMDDAAECFENILRRIHFHIANNHHEDTCSAPHCLPHQKFSLNIVEKVVCPCGASSSPLKFNEMVHYISASALVSQAKVMQETGDTLHPDRFGLLLRNANAMGDIRDCPGSCGKKVPIRRTLLNSPDIVSIGLVWDSDHPTIEMTTDVARNMGTTILMQDVFHAVMQDVQTMPKLHLVGLVCYYGKHYSTFVFHSKLQVWIYFDDATVKEIGPNWEDVVDKCSKGRYQPLLLLYANPNAGPVPVETAPKKRVMAAGYHIPGGPEEESCLDRTSESISSQHSINRSRTPNPEPQSHRQEPYTRARSVTPSGSESNHDSPFKPVDHSRQQSFLMAMGGKPDKAKHPLRFGGQANSAGPMASLSEEQKYENVPRSKQNYNNDNYSDYTLSTSDQYRRPSMRGFEPTKLPLTPNMKGYHEPQRKESFSKTKEPVRADVVRYPVSGNRADYVNYDQLNQPTSSYYQNSGNPRQRTLSQGGDEAYGSDSSSYDGPQHHSIIKPVSQNYDCNDGLSHSHTPVQSGLATLPRRKKESPHLQNFDSVDDRLNWQNSRGNSHSSERPMSNPQYFNHDDHNRPVSISDPSALPPPVPSKNYLLKESTKKDSDKKLKKAKKELKKAEKKKMKEASKSQTDLSTLHQTDNQSGGTNEPVKPGVKALNGPSYIDRRMVENILSHQGLKRQPSTHSTNSSSSIESDSIMGRLLAGKQTDVSFDNVSLGSHKDSGYGSSDRNSASSTGSGTIDPHIQYFISKSMVVPRNLNPNFHPDRPPPHLLGDGSSQPHVYTAQFDNHGIHRKIMHPIKESSQEDILKIMSKDSSPVSTPVRGLSPAPNLDQANKELRPPPIPPKNFAAFQVSKSVHRQDPSIDSLDRNEVKNDYFVSMCEKADELMDSCILAETEEDLTTALRLCDSALDCLKEAMNQTDISNKALVYAQRKNNSCLLKSRSLTKRIGFISSDGSGQSKRSSITSTDSDNSDKMIQRRTPTERKIPSSRSSSRNGLNNQSLDSTSSHRKSPLPHTSDARRDAQPHRSSPSSALVQEPGLKTHVSRIAERGDVDSHHSRSGSNSSMRSSASVPSSISQTPVTSLPKSQSAIQPSSMMSHAPIDAYGTLPRNRKNRRTSDPVGNAEVYQMYLNQQKNLQGSGSSSEKDSRESDSSSEGNSQKKLSKAEIRELLENNVVQRQRQQMAAGSVTYQDYREQKDLQLSGSRHSYDEPRGSNPNIHPRQAPYTTQDEGYRGMDQYTHSQAGKGYLSVSKTNSAANKSNIASKPSHPVPQANHSNPSYNTPTYSQSAFRPVNEPNYVPIEQVSGYTKPLPGQRGLSSNLNRPSSANGSPYSQQDLSHMSSHRQNQKSPSPPNQLSQYNRYSSSTSNLSSSSQPVHHQRTNHNSLSNMNDHLNNFSTNESQDFSPRKPGPPPPARVSSNPDFRNQAPNSQRQQFQNDINNKNTNVARIQPNSHITTEAKTSFTSNYQQEEKTSFGFQNKPDYEIKTSFINNNAQDFVSEYDVSRTASSGMFQQAVAPITRTTSQPNCKDLPDSTSVTSRSDITASSFPASQSKTSSANPLTGFAVRDGFVVRQHVTLPNDSASDQNEDPAPKQSVKDLASRFDVSVKKPAIKPKPLSVSRTRSKSESGSKKPKSVLKSKKAKNSGKPRKSVTFAEDFSALASGYESAAELSSFTSHATHSDRAYFSDDEENFQSKSSAPFYSDNEIDDVEDSSNSDDTPLARDELACQLCRKREVIPGKSFCSKCSFYMGKLSS